MAVPNSFENRYISARSPLR